MTTKDIIAFKNDPKSYELLKENSQYIKYLNRGEMNYEMFVKEMKSKYKERTSDKIEKVIDNIDLVSNILDIFK